MYRNESHLQGCTFPVSLSNCTERSEGEPESGRQNHSPLRDSVLQLRFIAFRHQPSAKAMGDAWMSCAAQTAPAALPGGAGRPRLRRRSIAASAAELRVLHRRLRVPPAAGMRDRSSGRTPPQPGGAPLRSPPASPCVRRTAVNTGAAPPRDRCAPGAAEAGRSAAGGGTAQPLHRERGDGAARPGS